MCTSAGELLSKHRYLSLRNILCRILFDAFSHTFHRRETTIEFYSNPKHQMPPTLFLLYSNNRATYQQLRWENSSFHAAEELENIRLMGHKLKQITFSHIKISAGRELISIRLSTAHFTWLDRDGNSSPSLKHRLVQI